MAQLDPTFWAGKRVLVTGHTGFKGAWLTYWLGLMGAQVTGYSLAPATNPSMFQLLDLEQDIDHHVGDICDRDHFTQVIHNSRPDIVMHLAAQPIVSEGYEDPVHTFETNIMGVVHLLQACRAFKHAIPVLIISSDKCYLNNDTGRAFEIDDPLGGHDPYSASKAGTEIVTSAYRQSFFKSDTGPMVASARAGNVVGGGDWSLNRLLPDCARAFSEDDAVLIRNPLATRPWQHVLEPLYGYMVLIQNLIQNRDYATAWNFGPIDRNHQPVGRITEIFTKSWGDGAKVDISNDTQDWREAKSLDLNCAKTTETLKWSPLLDIEDTITWSADWYKTVYASMTTDTVRTITKTQIQTYEALQSARA